MSLSFAGRQVRRQPGHRTGPGDDQSAPVPDTPGTQADGDKVENGDRHVLPCQIVHPPHGQDQQGRQQRDNRIKAFPSRHLLYHPDPRRCRTSTPIDTVATRDSSANPGIRGRKGGDAPSVWKCVCADFRALCWVAAASASLPMAHQTHSTIGKLRRLRLPLPPGRQIVFTDMWRLLLRFRS